MYKKAILVVSCLMNLACTHSALVTESFDSTCEFIEFINTNSTFEYLAIKKLKQDTTSLGGNTLLIGSDGLDALRDYLSEQRLKKCPFCAMDEGIATASIVPPGQKKYFGAVMDCRRNDI